jgi:hypothetical protein
MARQPWSRPRVLLELSGSGLANDQAQAGRTFARFVDIGVNKDPVPTKSNPQADDTNWKLMPSTFGANSFCIEDFAMTAIVLSFVRGTTRDYPDFAVIAAFSLAGLVFSLALVHLGFDLGAVIPG